MYAVPLRQLSHRVAVAAKVGQCYGLVWVEPDLGLPGDGLFVDNNFQLHSITWDDCGDSWSGPSHQDLVTTTGVQGGRVEASG
jgi:hypothetical protein